MKPCPFCGHPVDMEDPDTLYPNGVAWKIQANGTRTFHNFKEAPSENWCYTMHCVETAGGCGAEVSGNTKQEAIDKWNRRV